MNLFPALVRTPRLPLWLLIGVMVGLSGCAVKKLNPEKNPIPPDTLVIEFANRVNYVVDLKIDGIEIPINYSRRNKRLWVHGLKPGPHQFTIHSLSYVFGPEFGRFTLRGDNGAYFFVQGRKYRSALPKKRSQVSIRAYRRQLRKEKRNQEVPDTNGIWAEFK